MHKASLLLSEGGIFEGFLRGLKLCCLPRCITSRLAAVGAPSLAFGVQHTGHQGCCCLVGHMFSVTQSSLFVYGSMLGKIASTDP